MSANYRVCPVANSDASSVQTILDAINSSLADGWRVVEMSLEKDGAKTWLTVNLAPPKPQQAQPKK